MPYPLEPPQMDPSWLLHYGSMRDHSSAAD